ncbi:SRPBCC domain-containing protein [Frondihabitans sp. VKM Ac-2883]|uniref:SRPBCC family protein n=1 Tax=Frondihabitans sp. VKM Ac-2883 TaxID=2783823 RepID=UPI00188CE990|nr:SRPBCC domain-containing protein [Frondihabitans sp. VKM Ac-2883]MBF4575476.1 SRPBCC domain-containing protein [Frondihabitans sp. VKM Ac-2883]
MPANDRLSLTVTSGASVAAVWFALTDGRDGWWPELSLTPEVGAAVRETWTEDGQKRYADGHVTEAAPPNTLGFVWRQPAWASPLHVRLEIEPAGSGSIVALTEEGFAQLPDGSILRSAHCDGWSFHLANLLSAASR